MTDNHGYVLAPLARPENPNQLRFFTFDQA
jgi:hypothetical protein